MAVTVTPTQTQIFTALVSVLASFGLVASDGVTSIPIIRGQVNRVPEPTSADYVVLWPITRDRLSMNVDGWTDAYVTGAISQNVLTVSAVPNGPVPIGAVVYGADCQILRQTSGTAGGVGTYTTTQAADVALTTLYCGTSAQTQATEVTIQADVHGPASADNAARIATLFRDQFGVSAFLDQGQWVSPLYTTTPRQMPFENGEQQTEERWIVDLTMQANVTIATPQQFAAELAVTLQEIA
jgi:hypothetical protein